MIESSLRTYLLSKPAMIAVVGQRIHCNDLPQNCTFPAIAFQTISDIPDHHLRGANGLSVARIQVNCYALTYEDAKLAAEALRLSTDGFCGTVGVHAVNPMTVEDQNDLLQPPITASEKPVFGVAVDLRLAYQQTPASF